MDRQYKERNRKVSLPSFCMADYANLVKRLLEFGYQFRKVSKMKENSGADKFVYLRHDIDFHIYDSDEMAKLESSLGISATYYVLLTQHYNPLNNDNKKILRKIRELGHEIGLHYDLQTYPQDPKEAKLHLDWEVGILSKIIDAPIQTISTHLPYKKIHDPFLNLDEYLHPHNLAYHEDLLYVSDSCRAWRDESLLTCFGQNPPRRLLLCTHPEVWLDGRIIDRMSYLDKTIIDNSTYQYREYFDKFVRRVWLTYPAAKIHDERISAEADKKVSSNNQELGCPPW